MLHLRTLTVGVALLVVLAIPAIAIGDDSASISTSPPLPFPNLPDSSQVAGESLVSGTVSTTSGDSPSSGGVVFALAWPDESVLADMSPGDTINLEPVAQTDIAPDGSFSLRASDQVDLSSFSSGSESSVNFDLVSIVDGSVTVSSFSRELDANSELGGSAPDISVTQASTEQADDSGLGEAAPETSLVGARRLLAATLRARASASGSDVCGINLTCRVRLVRNMPARLALVGETYNDVAISSRFKFLKSAVSQLGVGFSYNNVFGRWSASGTASDSTRVGASWGWTKQKSNTMFYKEVQYRKYVYETWHFFKPHWRAVGYEVRPWRDTGGFSTRTATSVFSTSQCANITGDVWPFVWDRNQNNLRTFGGGMNLAGLIGIDLSAQTGASQEASVHYRFRRPGRVCGDDSVPADSGRVRSLDGLGSDWFPEL
jgi:hypothetical protein